MQSAEGGLVESHAATKNVQARAAVISPTKRMVIVHILQCYTPNYRAHRPASYAKLACKFHCDCLVGTKLFNDAHKTGLPSVHRDVADHWPLVEFPRRTDRCRHSTESQR